MFTGLIEEVGTVVDVQPNERSQRLEVSAPRLAGQVRVGDSVAVNGCCLTAAVRDGERIGFDLLNESIERTNLKAAGAGSLVNLELALAAGSRLGGHFVQGHVDCAAPVRAFEEKDGDWRLKVELPAEFARYVAFKGSIAVNGISLTVAEVSAKSFAVWIIPHTRAQTNLAAVRAGDLVNLEFDLLAKYVERMIDPHLSHPT